LRLAGRTGRKKRWHAKPGRKLKIDSVAARNWVNKLRKKNERTGLGVEKIGGAKPQVEGAGGISKRGKGGGKGGFWAKGHWGACKTRTRDWRGSRQKPTKKGQERTSATHGKKSVVSGRKRKARPEKPQRNWACVDHRCLKRRGGEEP